MMFITLLFLAVQSLTVALSGPPSLLFPGGRGELMERDASIMVAGRISDEVLDGAAGIRSPSYSRDGSLVVSVDGDILLRRAEGEEYVRLTSGAAWDRDPAFTGDGRWVLFSSDRSGGYSIYRVSATSDGSQATPERLTDGGWSDRSPVEVNGQVFFLRGGGASSRIWTVGNDGKPHQVGNSATAQLGLTASADGSSYAFIEAAESGRRIVVRKVTSRDSASLSFERDAQHIALSPDGSRIAYATRTGTFIAPLNGSYSNFVSSKTGELAWSPAGNTLAIASYTEPTVSYNGDPDRGLDRTAAIRFERGDSLYFVTAPEPPDHQLTVGDVTGATSRAERNAEEFERLWQRTRNLYFKSDVRQSAREEWDAAYASLKEKARKASSDEELQEVMYSLIRKRPPLREEASGRAAVSSAHPVATQAGLEILRAGGNVVDAAVAVSFALGVVEPDASGIGGYGQMVIALSSLEKPTLIEFMSRVPEDASLSNTSLLRNGRYPPDGPVLVNVPGTVAGMHEAWKKYGSRKLPWSLLVQPAIRAARDGYEVSEGLATTLATEREHFIKYPSSTALFFRDGKPMVAGDTVRNPDLAWVLEQIAANGADGFYTGEVARRYVDSLRAGGNAMKLSDMARYFAPERSPVSGTYRGYTIYSSAPPVSGGAELVGRLNLLEHFPAPRLYTDDAMTLHAALSAWFLVPSSRGRIADPAMWPVDVAPIINRDTAALRWNCFNESRALRPTDLRGEKLSCASTRTSSADAPGFGTATSASLNSTAGATTGATKGATAGATTDIGETDPFDPCGPEHAAEMTVCHSQGTTAFAVADNQGNMVAVTQTLGTWGGNFQVAPGLGFLSNDKLTSLGTDPNQYGSRLPFARHGSTIAPTVIYRNNRPVFAIGAAGNAWITSAIYQGVIGAIDFNLSPQQVLELPRFLPGGGGRGGGAAGGRYSIQMENGFSPSTISALRSLGYDIQFVSMPGELREGYGAAIRVSGKTVTAGADPRRSGAAGAIRD